jgi:hypothetical protein
MAFLNATIGQIKTNCIGLQVEVRFSLDEVRISEWEDRKPTRGVIPLATKDEKSITRQTEA